MRLRLARIGVGGLRFPGDRALSAGDRTGKTIGRALLVLRIRDRWFPPEGSAVILALDVYQHGGKFAVAIALVGRAERRISAFSWDTLALTALGTGLGVLDRDTQRLRACMRLLQDDDISADLFRMRERLASGVIEFR